LYDVAKITARRLGKGSRGVGTVVPAEYHVTWVGGCQSWEVAGSGPGSISETSAFKMFVSKSRKRAARK
jgi:hypothetical protein